MYIHLHDESVHCYSNRLISVHILYSVQLHVHVHVHCTCNFQMTHIMSIQCTVCVLGAHLHVQCTQMYRVQQTVMSQTPPPHLESISVSLSLLSDHPLSITLTLQLSHTTLKTLHQGGSCVRDKSWYCNNSLVLNYCGI